MERSLSRFMDVMLIVLVLSAILQLAGLVTPGWIVLNTEVYTGHMGLFYATICVQDACQTKTYDEFQEMAGTKLGFSQMTEFQAETITGLISCVIAIVILILTKRKQDQPDRYRHGLLVTLVTAALSAILSLVAAGQFANGISKANSLMKAVGVNIFGFPYSVLLSGFGGILAGICVLALIARLLSRHAADSPPPYSLQINDPSANVHYPGTQPSVLHYELNPNTPNNHPGFK